MTRGSSPTYTTSAHENHHQRATLREARDRYLEQREAKRQAIVATAVVVWDAGCA